jgi:hypothetical protein
MFIIIIIIIIITNLVIISSYFYYFDLVIIWLKLFAPNYMVARYDFVPNSLHIGKDQRIHLQWTGSNTHNNGGDGGDGQVNNDEDIFISLYFCLYKLLVDICTCICSP